MIWLTSDHHFNHKNIIRYCNRPFETVEEMNDVLIVHWNKYIKPNDSVLYLGDFGFGKNCDEIFNILNGTKFLIPGNHDHRNKHILKLNWDILESFNQVSKNQHHEFIFTHEPIKAQLGKNQFNIHGHTHGYFLDDWLNAPNRQLDISVDCMYKLFGEFRPISLREVYRFLIEEFDNEEDQSGKIFGDDAIV